MHRTLVALAATASLAVAAPAASAATDGTFTQTLSIAVRSVTLTPDTAACQPRLTFPNGICATRLVILNGGMPSTITAAGDNATNPANGAVAWSLCQPVPGSRDSCSGAPQGTDGDREPGPDQYGVGFLAQRYCYIELRLVAQQCHPLGADESFIATVRTVAPSVSSSMVPELASAVHILAGPA